MRCKKFGIKLMAMLLMVCVSVSIVNVPSVEAKTKKLTLTQAKSLGLTNSADYQSLQSKLELAQIQYQQAVKSLQLKEENQRSFRWSPLLSFKLPESPNLTEAYEYEYKPTEYASQIDTLRHQITDEVYAIYEDVESLYVSIYSLQQEIEYNEELLESYEKTLNKNKKRLALGTANQTDIDTLESKVDSIESTLVSDNQNYEAKKVKLKNLIGVDVTSGYEFTNPFVDGEITREQLQTLIDYTIKNDQSCYEARVATENAELALQTNYDLMKEQYGSDITMLDSYINQIKKGEIVNSSAFKSTYNRFLTKIEEPWTGSYKIGWFIKIPKAWLKGAIDGVRYVEDEPYVLYESALEYRDAVNEQESTETEVSQSVTDSFENYVSTKRSLDTLEEQLADKKTELDKDKTLNLLGKMTYEEYSAVQEEYEEMQLEYLQTEADYNDLLYSFDRLTCGKVLELLGVKTVSVSGSTDGGYSYAVENEGSGVYYYIHQIASDNVFELGLTVSEDTDVELTDFELWVDSTQIGERTELGSTIRHLTLDLTGAEKVFIRLYNGDEFLDDCEIDPSVYSAKLSIKTYTVETVENDLVGHYGVSTDDNGMMTINIIPEMDTDYAYYNIMTEDEAYLIGEDQISLKEDFTYLQLAESSLEDLIINFYDEGGNLEYQARFKTSDQSIRKILDE